MNTCSNTPKPQDRRVEKFLRFHKENPHVYGILVDLARKYVGTGKEACSTSLLINVARWELMISTENEDYLINNDFGPFYARLIMWHEEDMSGLFRTRKSIADEMDLNQVEVR